jgi:hypothetical protein
VRATLIMPREMYDAGWGTGICVVFPKFVILLAGRIERYLITQRLKKNMTRLKEKMYFANSVEFAV